MSAKSPVVEPATIERKIAEQAAAAKLRLRFDKVVVRLVGGLKAALTGVVPEDQTVVFTVTAPIRLCAKTAAALESMVRGGLPDSELRGVIHGNDVRVRRVTGVSPCMPRVLGFVHNPESDADLILGLAEARLLGRN
ncbi:MAG TPA: hypothetical protein VE309_10165 [Caulobacteraceae bacterium]|jgi:hypothetical protein|nr:hypothetical protein [Caulobacteraceae bacterium]